MDFAIVAHGEGSWTITGTRDSCVWCLRFVSDYTVYSFKYTKLIISHR